MTYCKIWETTMINKTYKKILLALLITCSIATPAKAGWFVNPFSVHTYHTATQYILNFMQIHPTISTAMVCLGIVAGGIELVIRDTKKDIAKQPQALMSKIVQNDDTVQENTRLVKELEKTAQVLQNNLHDARNKQATHERYTGQTQELQRINQAIQKNNATLVTKNSEIGVLKQQLAQEQAKLERLNHTIKLIKQDITEQQAHKDKAQAEKPAPAQHMHAQQQAPLLRQGYEGQAAAAQPIVQAHQAMMQLSLETQLDQLLLEFKDIKRNKSNKPYVAAKLTAIKNTVANIQRLHANGITESTQAKMQLIQNKINELEQPEQSKWKNLFGGEK